jgi:RNA polymerase subunit RPABC4/transcription elongation factor Spt4
MSFCTNCGKRLNPEARFCGACGKKTPYYYVVMENAQVSQTYAGSQRQQEYVGKVYKCPNCGETINQNTAVCPACGYKISGADANATVKDFSQKLMAIESRRLEESDKHNNNFFNDSLDALFNPYKIRISNTDYQIVSLIKSFPVPNTIDEIKEFMYLSAGNIDVNLSKNTFINNSPGGRQTGGAQKAISDAWVAKMQQVYAKAESLFPEDPAFQQLREIYVAKMKELKMKVK